MADLDQRMTALEAAMAEMRQEWERQRHVPAAQTGLLNAMRATQLEHSRDIGELKRRVGGLEKRVGGLEEQVAELGRGLGEVKHGVDTIVGLLTTLIEREPPPPA